MVVYLPSSLVGWRSWFVAGLGCLRLWIRPRPKSVDFHDVRNRQRPCRMTIRHPKNSFSACLAWVISAKLNTFAYGMYGFASLRLWCLPLLLSSNKVKTFKYFCSFYSSKNNYAKLRKYMAKLVSVHSFPCIPYLALYLEDLMKIHRENPGPAICNLRRITLMMDVIYLIQKFQKSSKKSIPLCHSSCKHEERKYCLSINFSKDEQKFLRSSCEKYISIS
ncbi:UNVERIFIED_CONTAM: Ras-specific guanine nucleotide-releasing factor RalGPS2 [Trichonephila clavipes]